MRGYLLSSTVLMLISVSAFAAQPKEVIIANETLNVTGEVTAVIAEPLTVEGEVTIGNTVGVDVLSLPPGGSEPTTALIWSNVQVVAGDPTFNSSLPLPIPENARLLFSNINAGSNENADGCVVAIRLAQAGGPSVVLGGAAVRDSSSSVYSTVQLGKLPLGADDELTTACQKLDDIDDGNCICNSVVFYETD